MHHIVSDGWSTDILIREFKELYEAFAAGGASPLPALELQYGDYSVWQREWLQGEVLERQLAYWREALSGAPATLELMTDHPRPATQDPRGAVHDFLVPAGVTAKLRDLGRRCGATLFMTLLAAFDALLFRHSGQTDVCVGTPVANRRRVELEGLIGFFVNTLVMRADLSGDPSFVELLRRVRAQALGAQANQDLPFERLVEELQPERDMSRSPLFQTMFILQNAPLRALGLSGLRIDAFAMASGTAKFDLTLQASEGEDGLFFSLEYATTLFDALTIERMARRFQLLLEGIATSPERRLSELPLLPPEERRQILFDWNPARTYAENRCLHELFEEQAARSPGAVAVVFEDTQLSYGELNAKANRLAHYLRRRGVGPEVIVGLCVERSLEMVIGLLGVLKAGGAYLPLDPSYPRERLAYMIEDARPTLVLTQAGLRDDLPPEMETLRLDADWARLEDESEADPASGVDAQNLAYIIYTSGSTGKPKGVGVAHGGLSNLADDQAARLKVDPASRMLQFSSLSFDAAVFEIATAFVSGARLVLAPSEKRAGDVLCELLASGGITHALLPPVVLTTLTPSPRLALERLVLGGESFAPKTTAMWHDHCAVVNAYGPTEYSVIATMSAVLAAGRPAPIGHPIGNTQVYLLDSTLNLVPVGVAGELCIGGVGLARGYVNRPDLTAARFVPSPFGEAGARLYRTGDLARYLADGSIECLGRIDHQVKIRGFRIELGEIEAALVGSQQVRTAAVTAREDPSGGKRLIAYVVGCENELFIADELRAALRKQLPEHMIPAAFITLDAMPLTPSGKIDRKSLPSPDFGAQNSKSYVAPRNVLEWVISREFQAVLGLDRVGVHDKFFELGGASISAMKLADRIRRTICSALPMSAIFQAQSIAELAAWISNDDNRANSPLVLMRPGGEAPPVFLVHPAGGSIIRYQDLAQAVPTARAVYGCQSRHLFENSYHSLTLDEMAADYVARIFEVQPRGPYYLLGWSMGGVTAMTMASVIERGGERVAFVGLLDTHYDIGTLIADETATKRDAALMYLRSFARLQSIRGGGLTPDELEATLSEADLDHLAGLSTLSQRDCFVQTALWGQERGFWSNISAELMNFLYSGHEASTRQMQEVSLRRISAPIYVWWSQETIDESQVPLTDWGAYTEAEAILEIVPGDHETIVNDAYVHQRVAEVLESLSGVERRKPHGSHLITFPS